MMNREDREIQLTRLRMLDLVKSFFTGEPDAEKLSRWRGTFSALTRERVNPSFDQSVRDIHQYLEKRTLSDLQSEYYDLFINPFTNTQLNTEASYYFDGKSYGKTLVELRSFLTELGIEKNQDVIETEDSLVVMIDVMASLINRDVEGTDDRYAELHNELLQKYLLPLSESLKEACEKNESAYFYAACSRFFYGYLNLEKGLAGSEVYH